MGAWGRRIGNMCGGRWVRFVGVALLALLGLNLLILAGLNGYVRWSLAPRILQEKGLNLHVSGLWFNLFTGKLSVEEVRLANPPGSPTPELCRLNGATVDIDWFPLLWGAIRIASVDVHEVRTTIVRQCNEEGGKSGGAGGSGADEARTKQPAVGKDAEQAATRVPRLSIGGVRVNSVTEFCAVRSGSVESRMEYRAVLTGSDFRTDAGPGVPWATFAVTGNAGNDPSQAALDVRGTIAPSRELTKPTFRLSGTLTNAELSQLQMVFGDLGIKGGHAHLAAEVDCVEGRFNDEKSWVDVRLRNMKGAAVMGLALPELDVTVPIQGTIAKPKVNVLKTLGLSLTKTAIVDVKNLADGLLNGLSKAGRKAKHSKKESDPVDGSTNVLTAEDGAIAERAGEASRTVD